MWNAAFMPRGRLAAPNAIGLNIVELVSREWNVLYLDGVDILDGTPLVDIKPYIARLDGVQTLRSG